MRICVIASGSKGNCTLISTAINTLIDIGMSCGYIEKKLEGLGVSPSSIKNVFITHPHVDHVAGLKVFIKKYNPMVFLTKKMYDELSENINFTNYEIIEDKIIVDDIVVEHFKTSHDASDSVGYIITSNGKSFVYVTDTGYINEKYFNMLKNKNIYVFESNHDVNMLMDNPNYPYQTKQRILSDKGHLSNKDSSYYLSKLVGDNTKHIVLAHLSEQNNTEELAYQTLYEKIGADYDIIIARQNETTEMIEA